MLQKNPRHSKQILYELCIQREDIFNPEDNSKAGPFLDDAVTLKAEIDDSAARLCDESPHEAINVDPTSAEIDLSDPDMLYSGYTSKTSLPTKFYSPSIVNSSASNLVSSTSYFTNKPYKQNSEDQQLTRQGACIDSGTQKTVVGLDQDKAYCNSAHLLFSTRKNNNWHSFGSAMYKSLGSLPIRIPTPGSFITLTVDVVRI